jgi:DNA-binding NtrC family response regulator
MTQRILALDDEIHMLKLLERIITEKTPHQFVMSNNALELPGLLEQSEFDLIITDLKMPGMDGMDVLQLVKQQERPEEVIIITAFGSLDTAIEALSKGVFDYITKPFKKEQIVATVDRAMRWQQMKRETRTHAAIFDLEPYMRAQQAFAREYVRRLHARCGGDRRLMLDRSGLSADEFQRVEDDRGADAS